MSRTRFIGIDNVAGRVLSNYTNETIIDQTNILAQKKSKLMSQEIIKPYGDIVGNEEGNEYILKYFSVSDLNSLVSIKSVLVERNILPTSTENYKMVLTYTYLYTSYPNYDGSYESFFIYGPYTSVNNLVPNSIIRRRYKANPLPWGTGYAFARTVIDTPFQLDYNKKFVKVDYEPIINIPRITNTTDSYGTIGGVVLLFDTGYAHINNRINGINYGKGLNVTVEYY